MSLQLLKPGMGMETTRFSGSRTLFKKRQNVWKRPDHLRVHKMENLAAFMEDGNTVQLSVEEPHENLRFLDSAIVGKIIGIRAENCPSVHEKEKLQNVVVKEQDSSYRTDQDRSKVVSPQQGAASSATGGGTVISRVNAVKSEAVVKDKQNVVGRSMNRPADSTHVNQDNNKSRKESMINEKLRDRRREVRFEIKQPLMFNAVPDPKKQETKSKISKAHLKKELIQLGHILDKPRKTKKESEAIVARMPPLSLIKEFFSVMELQGGAAGSQEGEQLPASSYR
ncbi:hypothetical protein M5K25_012323 [Dendrobium thyrsiflorum]|uniref:Uncharacterized protein n=1 Tax=Dendrobium thyrsiflorum TaxID=117978 RepID=A0ABD0V3V1_DENTH